MFGLGSVAQVVTGGGVFGDYLSINLGFGLGVAMGVHAGGKVSGKLLKRVCMVVSAVYALQVMQSFRAIICKFFPHLTKSKDHIISRSALPPRYGTST